MERRHQEIKKYTLKFILFCIFISKISKGSRKKEKPHGTLDRLDNILEVKVGYARKAYT